MDTLYSVFNLKPDRCSEISQPDSEKRVKPHFAGCEVVGEDAQLYEPTHRSFKKIIKTYLPWNANDYIHYHQSEGKRCFGKYGLTEQGRDMDLSCKTMDSQSIQKHLSDKGYEIRAEAVKVEDLAYQLLLTVSEVKALLLYYDLNTEIDITGYVSRKGIEELTNRNPAAWLRIYSYQNRTKRRDKKTYKSVKTKDHNLPTEKDLADGTYQCIVQNSPVKVVNSELSLKVQLADGGEYITIRYPSKVAVNTILNRFTQPGNRLNLIIRDKQLTGIEICILGNHLISL